MKRLVCLMFLVAFFVVHGKAQQVVSIEFHLYTDSLKKGVHNYINVDGKMNDGSWRPLSTKQLQFTSNAGTWDGNNLIIDSSYNKDSVVVTAALKGNTTMKQTVTIYMKRNLTNPKLKTEEELLNDWNNDSNSKGRRRKNGN